MKNKIDRRPKWVRWFDLGLIALGSAEVAWMVFRVFSQ